MCANRWIGALRADPRTRQLPVVVLALSEEDEDLWDGYGAGANSYVHKPMDFQRFVNLAKQLCLYWLTIDEPPPIGA
jgi:two-component system, response regulator